MSLKRTLSLWEAVLLGVGLIIGAGIYALVGVAGANAGPALWAAFAVAGVLAGLTAFSYAELSSLYPKAGSSYRYTWHAFADPRLSFLSGWLVTATGIVAATTVALAFGQYAYTLTGVNYILAAAALLVLMGALNMLSLKHTSEFNSLAALLEAGGLILFIALAWMRDRSAFASLSLEAPTGFSGFATAVALAFFAYLGFEVLANTGEELREPRKNLPRAILLSVGICAILYVLVAQAFTSLLPYEQIVQVVQAGKGPLAEAAAVAGGSGVLMLLSVVALFSTANTVLISLFGASRMAYGIAEQGALPRSLKETNRFNLPALAVFLSAASAVALLSLKDISLVGEAAVLGMLLVFALDNLAVVVLRFKQPGAYRSFRVPSLGNLPIPSLLAVFICVGLFAYEAFRHPATALLLGGLVLVGVGLHWIARHAKTHDHMF